jgi:hypothetical protein
MTNTTEAVPIERVQLGVRMEKRMVKVLKGLAEFEGLTLGQLLEKIVLHAFEPLPTDAPGDEVEAVASPFGKRAHAAAADFKRIYGLDLDVHAYRQWRESGPTAERSGDAADTTT